MNIALLVDPGFTEFQSLTLDNFCCVLTTANVSRSLVLADLSLQLDELMFLNGKKVDHVLFATNTQINWDSFKTLAKFEGAFYNTIWYTHSPVDVSAANSIQSVIHGNFYCTPKIFSILGAAHKAQLDDEPIRNFVENCGISWDIDFIRHRYITERANIKISLLP